MTGSLLEALRPKQWTKNLLLFAGVIFSQQVGDLQLFLRALGGFVSFSLIASCMYLINDLLDIEGDRRHPVKRLRPIASGRLSPKAAAAAIIPLLLIAMSIAVWLGGPFTIVIAIYVTLNLAYSVALKRQVLIDVFVIATGFVLRAIAGVELLRPVSPATTISPWLLVCTFFGALFLALAKRRRELANAPEDAAAQRHVLGSYTPELLDSLVLVSAAASLMGYALYTIWPATVAKFGTEALMYTIPIVAFGIFRYLYLVHVSDATEDPSQVLLTDRPLGGCVVLYLVVVVLVLYLV